MMRTTPIKHLPWKNILFSFFLFVAVAFLSNATIRMYGTYKDAGLARDEAQREENRLITRQGELEASLARINTDEGVEAELRKRYGVMRAGETEVVIVESKGNGETRSFSGGFWGTITGWFK